MDHSATVVHRADKLATNFEKKKVWQSVEAEQMQESGRLFVKIRPLYRVVKHLYLHSTVWLDRILFYFNFSFYKVFHSHFVKTRHFIKF